jgi:hypothetical protein
MSVPRRWLKINCMLTLPLPMVCPESCNKFSFSTFTMSFYLASKGKWLDLAGGIPGVWAWDSKLVSLLLLF